MAYMDLFSQLVRAEMTLWDLMDQQLRDESGITLAQFQALSAIQKLDGAARVQDISQEMAITVGATSKLVDRLERDGLAQRGSNPADRRSSIVGLTAQGEVAVAVAASAAESYVRATLGSSYSAARVAQLTAELAALESRFEGGGE